MILKTCKNVLTVKLKLNRIVAVERTASQQKPHL